MANKQRWKSTLLRLNILFIIVFLLFSILIFQLGVVQILNGESYAKKANHTIKDTTKEPVPRGEIYDRNHHIIVRNKGLYSITYTPDKGVDAKERLNIAKKLSRFITMYNKKNKKERFDSITTRDKKEYWYLNHEKKAKNLLTDEEKINKDSSKQYKIILNRIQKDEFSNLSKNKKNVILIKKEMDKAQTLTPQIIKNKDVTPEEYAKVAEHLNDLPGINATTDWNRAYPYNDTLKKLLGTVTSKKEGIPSDKEDYFLVRGYNRNDRVGLSGLEEQYESLLRGRKEQIEYTTNRSGDVIGSRVAVQGARGKDLVLSIDMELQKKVDKILRDELEKAIKKHPHDNRFAEDAMAVVMNPKTGELLAVSGQHYDHKKEKFSNQSHMALYNQYRPGSAVKGATVSSGYQSGVIKPGTTFYDEPIKIAGTPEKSSWKNLGSVNDINALKMSSNVYMFYIALRMGGEYNYQRNQPVIFHPEAFQKIRNYFGQFGLGVSTGIDYPHEGIGYEGDDPMAGNLMDFAIGQYDTYSTMQLAQYISTIANDGKRVQPHFLKESHLSSASRHNLGPVFKSFTPNVLNQLDLKQSNIKRIQEGFRRVYQESGGTAYDQFSDKDYNPAGKTGTAENEVVTNGKIHNTENNSLVGYAPFDNPEIAMAIMVPNTGIDKGDHVNNKIGEKIMDAYFDLKKESDD